MPSYNLLVIMGHLTRSPETRNVGQTTITEFGVAVNRKWTSNGEKKEEVTFVGCKAWGKSGEFIAQYFDKGDAIHLTGRISQEKWQDKQTGQPRSKLVMVVEHATFCGGRADGGGGQSQPPQRQQQSRGSAKKADLPFDKERHFEEADIPF